VLGAQIGANHRLQVGSIERLLECRMPRVERTKKGFSDERRFRFEMGVERANRQVGLGHDLRKAHGCDAVLTKEARCGIQDPFACRVVVLRSVSHRGNLASLHLDHDLTLRPPSFDVAAQGAPSS
jgi:hypothetical protein